MDPAGKACLITGAKRIGQAVAASLAGHGADVAICYRHSRAEAEAARERVEACGRKATVLQADLSDPGECARVVRRAAETFGRLDILVNMASVYRSTAFDDLTVAEWNAVMDTDLRASFLCAHAAAQIMRRHGGGRIVNVSDWLARSGRPRYKGFLAYYVAKAGVIGLTEALALELAVDRILVNAIAPGPIVPPEDFSAEDVEAVERATPLGRWGGEEEIAKAVVALVESDFITGETIRVDGGRHLS